jgi:site-specific recombinase XerD
MASIKFILKGTTNPSPIYIRLIDGRKTDVIAKTKFTINPKDWSKAKHKPKNLSDTDQNNLNSDLEDLKYKLQKYYDKTKEDVKVNTKWLKDFLNAKKEVVNEEAIPNTLIEYIDYYIGYRADELKESSLKKFRVIKHKMQRFQEYRKKTIYIKDINDKFKNEFVAYYKKEGYSKNTMQRELVMIKTFCKHAKYLGLQVHHQMDGLRLDREKVEKIYLDLEEIEAIKKLDNTKLSDSLLNARDWLIVSCFTGQRVSDFLRFTKDMIRIENGKHLLEFTQKKTDKIMTIPLHEEVLAILDKRNGNFPYKISDQKYNDYIKLVCQEAEINKPTKGSKKVETEEGSKQYRKKNGVYPKWELISSHVGRRSLATNFYGKIPTSYLIYMTGHSTEELFLSYIGKSNKDLAMELTKYF